MLRDDDGEVVIAAIHTYGDTIHSLVERRNTGDSSFPASAGSTRRYQPAPVGLQYVDHCVGNVELGRMNKWVEFYERRDGLQESDLVRRQGHLDRVLAR